MFSTSWLVTLFTRLIDFGIVYELFEIFLFERDQYLIFYLSVAFLKIFRSQILKLTSFEKLLKYLSNDIKVKDFSTLSDLYSECVYIRT